MATFQWDQVHLPPDPSPPAGEILGTLVPFPGESGEFTLRFTSGGATYATCTVHAPNDAAREVRCTHRVGQGSAVFQQNTQVAIDDGAPGVELPIWLRPPAD